MSYIDIEAVKTPGPGRYEEFRYNESPRWSLRPRTSSESKIIFNFSFRSNHSKNRSWPWHL